MSWFCSPCMASQLLRSCRHRRRICVSLTAQGFSWSIRSRRSPTNCQGIHSVMHLGTGYLWPKYHPRRLLITQKLEKMEHIWAQQTLPHDAYMLTDWAISHLKLPELQSLFLTVIRRICRIAVMQVSMKNKKRESTMWTVEYDAMYFLKIVADPVLLQFSLVDLHIVPDPTLEEHLQAHISLQIQIEQNFSTSGW
jgi:hypothetical protein